MMQYAGRVILQIGILFIIYQAAVWLVQLTALPVPANVAGMVILMFLLFSGILPEAFVQVGAAAILRYLGLLFVPFCVAALLGPAADGLVSVEQLLILTVTTIAAIAAGGLIFQYLERRWQQ
ncbi:CidA/LrgA family protein [Alkalicoccus luteus]|uniref:CidA/LrgA family protein n=1 Tax=Alkalicoccus luteus TaxID=1237094 RepID=A0A969TUJ9_9BACI|nr:CidA/LrgA family protein [Alkalicoccus luteus]NJP38798.1 CidA/LrgA family protein [Alkalicoccus luteus]